MIGIDWQFLPQLTTLVAMEVVLGLWLDYRLLHVDRLIGWIDAHAGFLTVTISLVTLPLIWYQVWLARCEFARVAKSIERAARLSVTFPAKNTLNEVAVAPFMHQNMRIDGYASPSLLLQVNNDGTAPAERFYVLLFFPISWDIDVSSASAVQKTTQETQYEFPGTLYQGYELFVQGPVYQGFRLRLPEITASKAPVGLITVYWRIASLNGQFPKERPGELHLRVPQV
jgi:hypothetical protein